MRQRLVLDYSPRELTEARRKVIRRHPSTGQTMVDASKTRLEELQARIRELAGDLVGLRRLADALPGRDVRGIARSLGRWDDVRPESVGIIRRRMNRRLLRTLWLTWEKYPDVLEVAELCAFAGDRYGWSLIASDEMVMEVARWVQAQNPGESIRKWLADRGRTYSDLAELGESPLRPNTRLTDMVRTAVMTQGTSRQLRAEGAVRLLRWFPKLSPANRQAFARHYLVTFQVNDWEERILQEISAKYGSPRGSRSIFWNSVARDRRDGFLRWLLRKKLDRAFSADTDRHRYWLSKVPQMVDVKNGRAGRTEYAWLVFEGFAVVEFFEVGNAAYFYSRRQARHLRATKPGSPAALKRRETVRFGWSSIPNWLIHSAGWQRQADHYVGLWSRGTAQ